MRRQLSKQVFQLAYFGKMSPEYISSLEVEERNYIYELLKEQLDEEKKQYEQEERKSKAAANAAKAKSRVPRR
jgi:hypothetical protein